MAVTLGKPRNGVIDRPGKREHQARDGRDVVKMGVRQIQRQIVCRVSRERGDRWVLWVEKRLRVRRAMDLDFCVRIALVALDENEIGRAHAPQKFGKAGLFGPAQFMHKREATGRSNEDLARAGLAMEIGILAGLIHVESMMRVLERRDNDAAFAQIGDQLDDQGRLARAAPPGKADYPHGSKFRKGLLETEARIPTFLYAQL